MINDKIEIILASGSKRRQDFFKQMGIPFRIQVVPIEETFPKELKGAAVAEHIVSKKAKPFKKKLRPNQLIITADTIVWHKDQCLGKPKDEQEAFEMLTSLSGQTHEVITAVGLLKQNYWDCFHVVTQVRFRKLSREEIEHHIKISNPFDKAGAYGVQEWIGIIGVAHIKGSYTNVIGLPVAQVYEKIKAISEL